jgi:phytoene dehydrogenase-like protein
MFIGGRMTVAPTANEFDIVVVGSGMGGMTTATALSRLDYKVLLLEQAQTIGGLTHAFSRIGFSWDVGLHYCGLFGPDQPAGKILDWLSGGTIEFRSVGTVYDTLHFPDGFEISVARPAAAYKMELKDRFPTTGRKSTTISKRCNRLKRLCVWFPQDVPCSSPAAPRTGGRTRPRYSGGAVARPAR